MERLVRIADALGRFSARFVPSAFAIAVLLTLATWGLALGWAGASPHAVLKGWGDGFWELLTFSMQMAVVVFTGYLVASAPRVQRWLKRVATLATSPRSAVVLMALASMGLAFINWGLSIVASAMLVRHVARQQPRVDYRLLVACAYFGLGATWHSGLSASAPLLVATPGHFLEKRWGVIPIDRTLFSAFNLLLLAGVVLLLTFLAWALHPPPERTVAIDPALLEKSQDDAVVAGGPAEVPRPPWAGGTLASWLDGSPWLNRLFALAGAAWLVQHLFVLSLPAEAAALLREAWAAGHFGDVAKLSVVEGLPALAARGWRHLNLNTVNFAFFVAAVGLHRTPTALLAASESAATSLSGIVLQFPLYAGIYGVFRATGLTERIGELFVSTCTKESFPAVVYWYSGVVNYFVPSGGSKWAIEAPYLLEAAARLDVSPEKVVLAYAWGDMATDLIQPFWAIPLLAIAKLEFKDVLGFLLLAFFVYVTAVSAAFWWWG